MILAVVFVMIELCSAGPIIVNDTGLNPEFRMEIQRLEEFDMAMTEHDFMETNPSWLFEGDVALTGDSRKQYSGATLWETTINYVKDPTLSAKHIIAINAAISEWESKTCLRFIDQTNVATFDTSIQHIRFTDDSTGCWSYMGKTNIKPQPINIGKYCDYAGTVIHEIGHAIGFSHEQQRTGRDAYVTILTQNVKPGKEHNFNAYTTINHGVDYDYFSIMHYTYNAFSAKKYEKNTIHSVDPVYQYVLGKGNVLSFGDEMTANEMYCTAGYAAACNSKTCAEGYLGAPPTCNCVTDTSAAAARPCGEQITSAGTFTTPNYPARSSDSNQRNCVWEIEAPSSSNTISVKFDDFDFYKRSNVTGDFRCKYDAVEVRQLGATVEADFKCDEELKGSTLTSSGNKMVILINSIYPITWVKGMKFTVSFN